MKYVAIIATIIFLTSCGSLNNISIDYDDDAELKSIKGSRATFTISATVDNPTKHKLNLKKVEFDIFRRGYTYADLSLPKQLTIPANSNQPHNLNLQIHFKDPFALLEDDFDIESDEYTLTGIIKVSVCLFSKKMKFRNVTFNQLINQLENL